MTDDDRVLITLHATEVPANLLAVLRPLIGVGFGEIRRRVAEQVPVTEVTLFDNAFYDGGGDRLLALLDILDRAGQGFTVHELAPERGDRALDESVDRITPDIARNTVRAAFRRCAALDQEVDRK